MSIQTRGFEVNLWAKKTHRWAQRGQPSPLISFTDHLRAEKPPPPPRTPQGFVTGFFMPSGDTGPREKLLRPLQNRRSWRSPLPFSARPALQAAPGQSLSRPLARSSVPRPPTASGRAAGTRQPDADCHGYRFDSLNWISSRFEKANRTHTNV